MKNLSNIKCYKVIAHFYNLKTHIASKCVLGYESATSLAQAKRNLSKNIMLYRRSFELWYDVERETRVYIDILDKRGALHGVYAFTA